MTRSHMLVATDPGCGHPFNGPKCEATHDYRVTCCTRLHQKAIMNPENRSWTCLTLTVIDVQGQSKGTQASRPECVGVSLPALAQHLWKELVLIEHCSTACTCIINSIELFEMLKNGHINAFVHLEKGLNMNFEELVCEIFPFAQIFHQCECQINAIQKQRFFIRLICNTIK